jgi:F-type H+-transporting ATPase subunit epsilon
MTHFLLEIISLDHHVFDGNVVSLTLPAVDGELTILPHHIPLIAPLKAGEIVIHEEKDRDKFMVVSGGFVIVDKTKVTILADNADLLDDLNEKKISEAKARAEKLLQEKQFADDRSFADATGMLEHSIAQLKVLKKRKKK